MKRLTKRYLVEKLPKENISEPWIYERYYLNDNLRIQSKNNIYEKEIILSDQKSIIERITKEEFIILQNKSSKKIIRKSYLYLKDKRISIKEYEQDYAPFIRAEVSFSKKEEMNTYRKEVWMTKEITNTPLAFDSTLYKLSKKEFTNILHKLQED